MADNRSLFLISGFISLSLFTLTVSLFFYMMLSSKTLNTFALKKDNYISVSIEIPVVKTKKIKMTESKKQIIDPVEASSENSEVDINNLFDSVWTKKIKKNQEKNKKPNKRRIKEIQKKIKKTTKNAIQSETANLDKVQDNDTNKIASAANEVNEYLARIQALVYKYFYPPQNSQGNSLKAVISLSSIGKVLDFRILNYSSDDGLNKECDKIKSRLMSVVFPINPQSKSDNYIIILKSEE